MDLDFEQMKHNILYGDPTISWEERREKIYECPLCEDLFIDPVVTRCKHAFCTYCIRIWFKYQNTCPTCNADPGLPKPLDDVKENIDMFFSDVNPGAREERSQCIADRAQELEILNQGIKGPLEYVVFGSKLPLDAQAKPMDLRTKPSKRSPRPGGTSKDSTMSQRLPPPPPPPPLDFEAKSPDFHSTFSKPTARRETKKDHPTSQRLPPSPPLDIELEVTGRPGTKKDPPMVQRLPPPPPPPLDFQAGPSGLHSASKPTPHPGTAKKPSVFERLSAGRPGTKKDPPMVQRLPPPPPPPLDVQGAGPSDLQSESSKPTHHPETSREPSVFERLSAPKSPRKPPKECQHQHSPRGSNPTTHADRIFKTKVTADTPDICKESLFRAKVAEVSRLTKQTSQNEKQLKSVYENLTKLGTSIIEKEKAFLAQYMDEISMRSAQPKPKKASFLPPMFPNVTHEPFKMTTTKRPETAFAKSRFENSGGMDGSFGGTNALDSRPKSALGSETCSPGSGTSKPTKSLQKSGTLDIEKEKKQVEAMEKNIKGTMFDALLRQADAEAEMDSNDENWEDLEEGPDEIQIHEDVQAWMKKFGVKSKIKPVRTTDKEFWGPRGRAEKVKLDKMLKELGLIEKKQRK